MTFSKALHLLKQGARIRRRSWNEPFYLWIIADEQGWGDGLIYGCEGNYNSRVYYSFEQKDILAEDWELVKGDPSS